MSLTVSSIQSDVSIDVRQVLTATDSKLIGWIDRIHKDCLHSSVYSYLNIATTSFATVAGTQQYALPPTNIRRILGMYDQSRNRVLFPIERATSPTSQVEKQEYGPGKDSGPDTKYGPGLSKALSLQSGQPEYFRHLGSLQSSVISVTVTSGGTGYASPPSVSFSGGGGNGAIGFANLSGGSVISITLNNGGLNYTSAPSVSFSGGGGSGAIAIATLGALGAIVSLFPIPQQSLNIGVSYEQQVVSLVNPTDTLLIPEDGRNMVVSGVNFLANAFLKRTEEAQAWLQLYKELKTGISLS